MGYHWPGNVRELENTVERALILNRDGPLNFDRLILTQQGEEIPTIRRQEEGPMILDEVISRHIRSVLRITKGKVHGAGGAAEVMGLNPSTLRNRMNKLGISYGRWK
jgi:DNA-binding NtrC family response regulator